MKINIQPLILKVLKGTGEPPVVTFFIQEGPHAGEIVCPLVFKTHLDEPDAPFIAN